jgi:hypothetical protein
LKSVVARVTRDGSAHKITGFVLNDGTSIRSVEVKIDNGAWQAAAVMPPAGKFAWKVFSYAWTGATPGEHTIVSRATDKDGYVQPEQLPEKKTFLEDNSQYPRKVMIG